MTALVTPWDRHNQALVQRVHPPDWVNPIPAERYNLVVIGAGTAGLVTAVGAAGLGARVALVERHLMGGDCLNYGCVPSKTLLRSARALAAVRQAGRFGIHVPPGASADFAEVMERVRATRATISEHDSAKRFRELGVDVFLGEARFFDSRSVEVGGAKLRFKRAVIATGARATELEIPGLKETGFLTNETIFNLTEMPPRLAVIGGGPIGCELAQAFQRLGAQVTVFHNKAHLLDREDADAADVVQQALRGEGVELVLGAKLACVEPKGAAKDLHYESDGCAGSRQADAILVAAGRVPNMDGLNLEAVGVQYERRSGVKVDDHLRTTNPRIFACGDVCMNWKFTHAADFAARIVIQNALFFGRKKLSSLTMPWCTYTDPEVAHVGLSEHEAKTRGIELETFVRNFAEVDRAATDGETGGFVKVHVRKGTDRILGATIVGSHAGDLISEISVAMAAGLGLGRLANAIHPYPTRAEAIRQLGDAYNRTRLTPAVRKLFKFWLRSTR